MPDNSANTLRKEAKRAYRAKDFAGSVEMYGRLLTDAHSATPAIIAADRVGYASALLAVERTGDAATQLELAIASTPSDARLHYKLGEVLSRLGQRQDAAAQLAEAVRLEPNVANNHWRLALELRNLGEEEAAQRALRRCLEIDPEHVEGRLLEMGDVALSSSERDGQEEEATQAREADGIDETARLKTPRVNKDALRESNLMGHAVASRADHAGPRWGLLAKALGLLILSLWLRTLFP